MMRIIIFIGFFIILLTTSVPALCQPIAGCYPPPFPAAQRCAGSTPAPPITRSVQVDVPVPCSPAGCVPPACAPPCPTMPVQVRVDVVVRPEVPKPCPPQRFCCENPPVFEPIFCQAAGLVQSLIAAPLFLGERFMAHPVPMPLSAPCPVPCWRLPAVTCLPCLQPPPATQRIAPYPTPVRCAPPVPPVKAGPASVPVSAHTRQPSGPFAR